MRPGWTAQRPMPHLGSSTEAFNAFGLAWLRRGRLRSPVRHSTDLERPRNHGQQSPKRTTDFALRYARL